MPLVLVVSNQSLLDPAVRQVKRKARIRVTGWQMFDQEHPEQIGKTRVSRWEIHPITKIEVWSKPQGKPGRWNTL